MDLLLASRKSDLARLQSFRVGNALLSAVPSLKINYHFRESLGDINQEDPLWKMPEKGVFTQDFREGLIDGTFDMVIHSWKDLPVEQEPGTEIVATLPRADARDLFLMKKTHLEKVKKDKKIRVYSSSPRRIYNLTPFLKNFLPLDLQEVEFESVRGNIHTRVRKLLDDPQVDGLVLAKAAMDRLLLAEEAEFLEGQDFLKSAFKQCLWQVLPLSLNPTAAAQGALAIEVASDNRDLKELLKKIHCEQTWQSVQAERKILKSHGGGCHQKIGVNCLERAYGKITFLKGKTEAGEILDSKKLDSKKTVLKKPGKYFPEEAGENPWLQRKDLDYKKEVSRAHFIARSNAFPKGESLDLDSIVWTSGLKCWQSLALRGVWVNGSTEGLGEAEDFQLSALAPGLSWLKWTHDLSPESSWCKSLATYKVEPLKQPKNLLDVEHFFWMSGSSFKVAIEQYPEILGKTHYCGPGKTFHAITQVLKQHDIIQPPVIFLSYEQWKSWVSSKDNS